MYQLFRHSLSIVYRTFGIELVDPDVERFALSFG